ncbi:MAG: HEAT repeat domain-containing protein [Verrucomicrobia bacterium]|nr:HEAT repeat domain-containing protein [Verrucomicrobiota bacterium]
MTIYSRSSFFAGAMLFLASELLVHAETEAQRLYCARNYFSAAPIDSADYRKYAPDRKVDILHLALDVTPDFKQRTIAGKATLTFKPIAQPLDQLTLDAIDLTVESVTVTEKILNYQATDKKIVVTFAAPIPADQEARVTVTYRAQPAQGLYFRTPEMGYKPEDMHFFTQGEPIEGPHWYPCYDAPNEKFTSEITCRVPEGMVVLSNGKLVSDTKDATTGLVVVRWLQDKPHVNYLVSLLAGYFKKVEDKYRDIPLAFYTPASQIEQAASSFRDTKDAMAFFEQEIGVPYPWAKYFQVCVNDFVAGGMENTSITTLTDGTLFTDATENIRDSRGLVAHELAHQWFGDLVTCKDWSHTWLNEGFATYYDALHEGHKNGHDAMLYHLYQNARGFIDRPAADDSKPIVSRRFDSPMDQFSYLAYPKGGWVLHMLRNQLGEELYRRCIKTYLERHQFQNVVTEDLNAVIEELSGRSFDQFFDQWVYHAHHPELEVNYSWDDKTKLAKVSIRQTQKLSDDIVLFNFPLDLRFKSKTETANRQIVVKEKEEDFYFPLAAAPEIVRLDPDYGLLAKINFPVPPAMLFAQLADTNDVMGRIFAIEQIAKLKSHDAVDKLKQVLNNDSFFGVRVEAAGALRTIHSDEAREALLASTSQSDARVRDRVVSSIGGFYGEPVYESARKTIGLEKNPAILTHAIGALGGYAKTEVRELLLQNLNSTSYRNELANAAIAAMRAHDDPSYISTLQEALRRREGDFLTSGFGRGLDVLAYLARNEEKKDEVREFLAGYVNHKKRAVQLAALNALGTLGDPKAIALLEPFTNAVKDSPERAAAEKNLAELRAARKPVDDFKNLRNEVLELQKQDRELRKELDDLKKKLEAVQPKGEAAKQKAQPSTSKKKK